MTQFKTNILPRPYVRIYSGEKGHQFSHKPWVLELAKSIDIFIMVLISDMPNIKYYQKFGKYYG